MKKFYSTLVIIFIIYQSFSQSYSKYVVRFTDKNYTLSNLYTISNPSVYLSSKALQRRANQNIAIVQNDLPVNPAYIDSVQNAGIVTILCKSKWLNSVTIYTTDTLALNKINSFPFVYKVSSVLRVDSLYRSILKPKDKPRYVEEIGNSYNLYESLKKKSSLLQANNVSVCKQDLSYNYGLSVTQAQMINIDYLHNRGYHGEGMTIAVIDGGFWNADNMAVLDSLWINNQILGTHDFVTPGGNVFAGITHGMMVLSTMGGNAPGQIVGTAPKANYWLLLSEDASTEYVIEEYNWVSAAEFADSVGVDIINSSLGYSVFDNTSQNYTYSNMDGNTCISTIGADFAASKGILVVSSAGNSGAGTWKYITAPADADSILSVGAVNNALNPANFTSHGPSYSGKIKPNVAAMGVNAVAASASGGITLASGTSFSSPIMAGAAACLWQAFPTVSNMKIIDVIQRSASKYLNPDTLIGYGIPNFAIASTILSGMQIHDEFIKTFPNPFNEKINIIFFSNNIQMIDIEMFDITGKRVFLKKNLQCKTFYNYFSIDGFEKLSQGLYLIRIFSKNKISTKKVIKN